ncbi:MAG: hypothetical protein ACK481_06960 [Candidatus Melainabacteria bacterium]
MNSTLIDAIIEKKPANKFLSEMKLVIPWQKTRTVIEKEIVRSGRRRPSYDLILMFKHFCLLYFCSIPLFTHEACFAQDKNMW